MKKSCPFNNDVCDDTCALYISPEDLNETVRNKLASIGVLKRDEGLCSLTNMAHCLNRHIFESSNHHFRS